MRLLARHAALAARMGVEPERIHVLDRGEVVELDGTCRNCAQPESAG